MKNLLEKNKQNPLKYLMVVTLIYPVLPLALIAIWWNFVMLSSFFVSHNSTFSLQGFFWMTLALLFFLGGPIGLTAGVYSLRNEHSKRVFWSLLYGAICYAFIVVPVIIGSIMSFNIIGILHVAYLSMTLVVVIDTILNTYKKVYPAKLSIALS